MAEPTLLLKGARVSWNTAQGRTHGVVMRKATRRFKIGPYEVDASEDDPHWVVKSERTGKIAAHKADALDISTTH